MKKKYSSSYYAKNRKSILKKLKKQYKEDSDFRENTKVYYREKYHTDKEYHEKTKTSAKNRYHENEKYRLKTIKRAIKRNKLKSKRSSK